MKGCIFYLVRWQIHPFISKGTLSVMSVMRRQQSICHKLVPFRLDPVAETGFSHRLTAYRIVGHFSGLSYRKISGNNQVENSFIRISNISVPCPHAQLTGRIVNKKLWTCFGLWGLDRSQSPPCLIFRVKQIHQSTASERTKRLYFRDILFLLKTWAPVCHD